MGFVDRLADRVPLGEPGRASPAIVRLLNRVLGPVLRFFFRPRIEGWEHLPLDRPVLIVANHSGGGFAEIGCIAWLWLERFGDRQPLVAMAHPLGFLVPGAAWFLRNAGAVPSTYRHALKALAAGAPVLVYPGGDHEAFRPIWEAAHVDFAGRRGFLALARKAWVPIVPLGTRGSHYTVPILWRSRALPFLGVLPRIAGIKRLPITLPLVAGLALIAAFTLPASPLLAAGLTLALLNFPLTYFWPILPWPVEMRIGPAIMPEQLFEDGEGPLDEAYATVRSAVQALVVR